MNQSCTSAPAYASRAVPSRRGSSFFERLCAAWIVLGMHGSRLLVRQVQLLAQDAAHALFTVGHAKALFAEGDRIHDPPGRYAVALWIGSPQHPGLQDRQLALFKTTAGVPLGPVEEALWSGFVEADDPITQGLAIHGTGLGGFGPGCTLQGERNRHKAQRLGSVLCPACQPPQFGWLIVRPDRQSRHRRASCTTRRKESQSYPIR